MLFMLLFVLLPENRSKLAYTCGYADLYNWVEAHAIDWHKSELEKLDPGYRSVQASLRLVAARQKASDAGIGPMDPRYPDTLDFLPRLKKERDIRTADMSLTQARLRAPLPFTSEHLSEAELQQGLAKLPKK